MNDSDRAKDLNDAANAKAQNGAWQEARALWLKAIELDDSWAVPFFNLARNFLDHTIAVTDVINAERYLNVAEMLANERKRSEDWQVITQLPQMRQWLRHKKNRYDLI